MKSKDSGKYLKNYTYGYSRRTLDNWNKHWKRN